MENEKKAEFAKPKEKTYFKEAFLKDKRYCSDVVNAVLEDGKAYTKQEAEKLIEKFLKGE